MSRRQQFLNAQDYLKQFISDFFETTGIRLNIQALDGDNCVCLTNMGVAPALTAIEMAKAIVLNGLQTNQTIDSLIQGIENRPDLWARVLKIVGNVQKDLKKSKAKSSANPKAAGNRQRRKKLSRRSTL